MSTTLTFRPNEDRKCFDIPILNDQLDEGTESFSAEILSVPTGMGVVIGTPGRTIISITDDDGEGIYMKIFTHKNSLIKLRIHYQAQNLIPQVIYF